MLGSLPDDIANAIAISYKCHENLIYTIKWLQVGHYRLKENCIVLKAVQNGIPEFGIVKKILSVENLVSLHYDEHFHAYAVAFSKSLDVTALRKLEYHVPLQIHCITHEAIKQMFISLHHIAF